MHFKFAYNGGCANEVWSAGIFLRFSKNDLWFYFDNGRGTFQISLPNENVKYFLNETVQNDTVYSATIQIIYNLTFTLEFYSKDIYVQ